MREGTKQNSGGRAFQIGRTANTNPEACSRNSIQNIEATEQPGGNELRGQIKEVEGAGVCRTLQAEENIEFQFYFKNHTYAIKQMYVMCM